jgi:hypothetical protein
LTLHHVDQRTAAAKRVQALIAGLTLELGGRAKLSPAQRELVQRSAVASLMIEDLEARLLAGQDVDPLVLTTLTNAQRRLLGALGLRREPPPTPTPTQVFEDTLVERYKAVRNGEAA